MDFMPTIIATQRIIRKPRVTLATARGPNARLPPRMCESIGFQDAVSETLDFLLSYRQLLSHTMFSDIGKSVMKLKLQE